MALGTIPLLVDFNTEFTTIERERSQKKMRVLIFLSCSLRSFAVNRMMVNNSG